MGFDLSNVSTVEILSPDFQGAPLRVMNPQRVDTGNGALRSLMSVPALILGVLGTRAIFRMRGESSYDPQAGRVTVAESAPIETFVTVTDFARREISEIPGIEEGDLKVMAPGSAFGFSTTALITFQARRTG